MTRTLRGRLARGFGAQAFAQAVNTAIQVGSVPLFLAFWGVGLYGEWLVLAAIPAYLAMSDAGFGAVAATDMTMCIGRGDRAAALRSFQSVWLLICTVSLAVMVVVAILAFAVPLERWLNLTRLDHGGAAILLVLLGAHVLLTQQTGLVAAGFRCEGNYGLGVSLTAMVRLFEFGLLATAVVLGAGPPAAAAGYAAGRGIGTLVMRLVLRRVSPWIVYGRRDADMATIRRLTGPAFAFMGFPLGNALNLQGIVIVVGAVIGPAAVVLFSTLRSLTRIVLQFMQAINVTIWPEISAAFGAGDMDGARRLHRHSCQASLWLSGAAILTLALFGETILERWTGGRVAMDHTLFILLLVGMVLGAMWSTSSVALSATNRHQGIALIYVAASAAGVALALVLGPIFGVHGAAAAVVVGELFMALTVLRHSLRFLGERFTDFAFVVVRPPMFLLGRGVA